jgi:mRNA-degrading endonuclease RelE of RelBE toxin-antitoxin system
LYEIVIIPELAPVFDGLKVKDPKAYENVKKKIEKIANTLELNPDHCKNLRAPLQKYKRVHVNRSFVLVFKVDKKNELIIVYDYDRHKRVYKKTYQ